MGSWRLESFKMFAYLIFPVGAFVYFNHPTFYERSMRQSVENISEGVDLNNLAMLENMSLKQGLDTLDETIQELEQPK